MSDLDEDFTNEGNSLFKSIKVANLKIDDYVLAND